MSHHLKPCPFCGATDNDTVSPDMCEVPALAMHSYPGGYRIECEACQTNGPWHLNHIEAKRIWNRRAPLWQPIDKTNEATLPPLNVPVWLANSQSIWIGGREDDCDGWLWGNTYGSIWHNGEKWDSDLETDDDYNPIQWQPLPEPPKDQQK